MSIGYSIVGIKPNGKKHKIMLSIYAQCAELDIHIPREVGDYFNGYTPDSDGVTSDGVTTEIKYSKERNKYTTSYVVNLKDLPEDVTILKFQIS